jgi:hypothetical protein
MVEAVLKLMKGRMRRRSRIWYKQFDERDLTDERMVAVKHKSKFASC